jgi:hypothetical protein
MEPNMSMAIKYVRGDTYKGVVSVAAASAITISLATFTMRESNDGDVKLTYNSTDDPTNIYITGNGTATPSIYLVIDPADTASLTVKMRPADIELTLSTGEKYTLTGTVEIEFDQTR